jgi:hypothetical protein
MHGSRVSAQLGVLFFVLLIPFSLFAAESSTPRGFREIADAKGVHLYQRRRDYVHVIEPAKGASIVLLHGHPIEQGAYVSFTRTDIMSWWKEWSQKNSRAFSAFNGQFFDPRDAQEAPLAFSMKADGKVYEGYADTVEYPGKKKMLLMRPTGYTIQEYDDEPESLVYRPEENILIGLSVNASKSIQKPSPRTFIGIARGGDIIVFNSSMATQAYAYRVLRIFGAADNQTMMLDGGSSSHLVYQGTMLVPRTSQGDAVEAREKLPQMIGVQAGESDVSSIDE